MEANDKGFSRRSLLMVGVVLVLAVAAVALFFSLDDNRSGEIDVVAVNTLSSDVAIRGHDPVAYFTEGRPVMGDPAYQMSYGDALYQFASAEHLAMFQENRRPMSPPMAATVPMACAWA